MVTYAVMFSTWCIDPHLLVAQEDIIQENHVADVVDDDMPQDQPRVIERPTTVFVEQKGSTDYGPIYESTRRLKVSLLLL